MERSRIVAARCSVADPPLTDRYEFICKPTPYPSSFPLVPPSPWTPFERSSKENAYRVDVIQHACMVKDANAAGAPAPASLNGVIAGLPGLEEGEGGLNSRAKHPRHTTTII